MLHKLISKFTNTVPVSEISAHCDIPCKIYDPGTAILSALTVVRMIDLMEELHSKKSDSLSFFNTMSRYIEEKETQATLCKNEVRIIWGDYFKAPQMEKFPQINELSHNIMMAASKAKQEGTRQDGLKLVELVNEFADIFWQTKGVKVKRAVCPYPPSLEVVYPDL